MKKSALLLIISLLSIVGCSNVIESSSSSVSSSPVSSSSSSSSNVVLEYDTQWSFDENTHWHACLTPGHTKERQDEEPHQFEIEIIAATYERGPISLNTCKICGYQYEEDAGGVPLEHHYSDVPSYDEAFHWYACIDEGYEELQKLKEAHLYQDTVTKEPTYDEEGVKICECIVCHYAKTEVIPRKEIPMADGYTYDEKTHWQTSSDTAFVDQKFNEQSHSFNVKTVPATFSEEGSKEYTCTICGYSYQEAIAVKEHKYSDKYSSDDNEHWQACTDTGYESLYQNKESHTFRQEVVTEATFDNNGLINNICTVCGYIKQETTPIKEHLYDDNWTYDESQHWHKCLDEGYESYALGKDYHGGEDVVGESATADTDGYTYLVCPTCGYRYPDYTMNVLKSINSRFSYYLKNDGLSYYVKFEGIRAMENIDDLYVPSEHEGLPVTGFYDSSRGEIEVKRLHIPASIVDLGEATSSSYDYLFRNRRIFSRLEEIIVDENNPQYASEDGILYSKDKSLLIYCPKMKVMDAFETPSSVTTIRTYAFDDCSIKTLIFSDNVTNLQMASVAIGDYPTRIEISKNIKNFSLDAMSVAKDEVPNCEIVFKGINEDLLYFGPCYEKVLQCFSNENLNLYDGCYYLTQGNNPYAFLFKADQTITSCNIHSDCKYIGPKAFINCTLLESVNIPEGVEVLYNEPFYSCDSLKELTIPSTVTFNDAGIIYKCKNVETLNYKAVNMDASTGQQGAYIYGGILVSQCENLKTINIADGVKKIPDRFASWMNNLATLNIGKDVEYIGAYAFEGTGITSLVLPETDLVVREYCFAGCQSLKDLTINCSSLVYTKYDGNLGNSANPFADTSLKTLTIGPNVKSLGGNYQAIEAEKCYYNAVNMTSIAYECNITCEEAVIGDNVVSLPYHFISITKGDLLKIPASVRSFQYYCLGTSSIKSIYFENYDEVNIPDEMNTYSVNQTIYTDTDDIDGNYFQYSSTVCGVNSAFERCVIDDIEYYIKDDEAIVVNVFSTATNYAGDFVIPSSISLGENTYPVTGIGRYAFSKVDMGSLTIGENIKNIDKTAFISRSGSNSHLTTVNWLAKSVNDSEDIDSSLFPNNRIKTINIGNQVQRIPKFAFAESKHLFELVVPDSVNTIGEKAFYNTALTKVTLGAGVENISDSSFYGSYSLREVIDHTVNCSYNLTGLAGNISGVGVINDENDTRISHIDNCVVYSYGGDVELLRFENSGNNSTLVLPEGITSIKSSRSFSDDDTFVTRIVLPSTLDYLYLTDSSGVREIVMPKSITNMGHFELYQEVGRELAVYYEGSKDEFDAITFEEKNLGGRKVYYYSETQPTESGDYWHYVDGAITKW